MQYSDCAIHLPSELKQTNQTGEIIAIKEAVEITDEDAELTINTDSKTTIHGLTKKWEDQGYIGIENSIFMQAIVTALQA